MTNIIQACYRCGKPIACGAYTLMESEKAYKAGADFVKIFPAVALVA